MNTAGCDGNTRLKGDRGSSVEADAKPCSTELPAPSITSSFFFTTRVSISTDNLRKFVNFDYRVTDAAVGPGDNDRITARREAEHQGGVFGSGYECKGSDAGKHAREVG